MSWRMFAVIVCAFWQLGEPGVLAAPQHTADDSVDFNAQARSVQEMQARVHDTVALGVVCVTAYERIAPPAQVTPAAANADGSWQSASAAAAIAFERIGTASGLVIDDAGTILTCRSPLVTSQGTIAEIVDVEFLDRQHFYARVVASEPTINLAVLQLEVFADGPKPVFTPIKPASLEKMKAGYTAIAVADPFGPVRTFATGVISSLPCQECYQADLLATYVQTTMNVHPESIGGALASIDGEVIGILMPAVLPSGELDKTAFPGISYALPITTALTVGGAIRETQTHLSPWMGFAVLSMKELRAQMGDQKFEQMNKPSHGIFIQDVFTPSPATAADVRVGDFLLAIDNERVSTVADFQRRLYLSGIGRPVTLEIFRDGQVIKKPLTIERRAVAAKQAPGPR